MNNRKDDVQEDNDDDNETPAHKEVLLAYIRQMEAEGVVIHISQ